MTSPGAGILEMVIERSLESGLESRKPALVAIVISAILGLIGIAFFSISLLALLLTEFTLPAAAAIAACALLALSLLGIGLAILSLRRRDRIRQDLNANLVSAVLDMAGDVESGLHEPVRENPKMSVFLAALSGFLLADQSLRR